MREHGHGRPAKCWHVPTLSKHTQIHVYSSGAQLNSAAHRACVGDLCGPHGALGSGAAASPAPSGALPERTSQGLV